MWNRDYAGYRVQVDTVDLDEDEIAVSGHIMSGGLIVGEVSRTYQRDRDGLWVYVDTQKLYDTEGQGKGFGTAFNADEEARYRRWGVDRIELVAGETVGGYAWARGGFDFLRESEADVIWRPLRAEVERLGRWLDANQDNPAVVDEEYQQAEFEHHHGRLFLDRIQRHDFGDADYPTAGQAATLGYQPGMGKDDQWLGKRVMLGTEWRGVKPL
jgi:hypothetical protein